MKLSSGYVRHAVRMTLLVTAVAISQLPSAAAHAAPGLHTVHFHGTAFDVPTGWPVFDLGSSPRTCLRADIHAVYLGHEGSDPQCPTGLVGRTESLQVEPVEQASKASVDRATAIVSINGLSARVDPTPVAGEEHTVLPGLDDFVTASYGTDKSTIDRILATFRSDPSTGRSAATSNPSAAPASPSSPAPASSPTGRPAASGSQPGLRQAPPTGTTTIYTGEGFDACSAPSESTMAAWLQSPYRSLGVYIGGVNEACFQDNLDAKWIQDVVASGWSIAPIYVGLQAPCSGFRQSIDPNQATGQGQAAADDAVSLASGFGIIPGNALYFDMEGYNPSAPGCSAGVLAFLDGWTTELHRKGYVSGVYGSSGSTMTDLADHYNDPGYNSPDDIWFASWSCCPHSVYGDQSIPDQYWPAHRRLHQYQGGHDETWGGVTINIDNNYDDGGLLGGTGMQGAGAPGYVVDGWGGIHPFGGAAAVVGTSYWPGWDIARGIAASAGSSGYVLDGWGGLHPFGGASPLMGASYWRGWDIARAIVMNPCRPGAGGYVLDGWGGIHPFGAAPDVTGIAYWPGWDIARSLTLTCVGGSPSGYVLDGWGGLHSVGSAPTVMSTGYWPGQDVAVGTVLAGGGSGYVLDNFGGMHPFGGASDPRPTAFWPGLAMARGLAAQSSGGGYVLDAYGSVFSFGKAAPEGAQIFFPGIARGVTAAG